MSSDADDETACSDAMMNPMSSEAPKISSRQEKSKKNVSSLCLSF